MKLVLNNINDISLSDIFIVRNRIFHTINDIKFDGIIFRCNKNMMSAYGNRYIIKFDQLCQIKRLNDIFRKDYKSFLKANHTIEVIKNEITEMIFNDDNEHMIINIKSINDNNYPKIHILQWMN